MKKILCIMSVLCIFAAVLTACSNEVEAPQNLISPKELTQDQQDIVDLLSNDKQEILLFDYTTDETYKSIEFWVEVYENGELVDRPSGINSHGDEARPINGQLAILINHDSGITWTFATSEEGSRVSHSGETLPFENNDLGRSYGPISDPVEIEPEKEIVLYTSFYSADGVTLYSDRQRYNDEPDLLNQYPYAHIIKCRFE